MMTRKSKPENDTGLLKLSDSADNMAHDQLIGNLIEVMGDPVLEVRLADFGMEGGNTAASVVFGYSRKKLREMVLADLLASPLPLMRALKRRVSTLGGVVFTDKQGHSLRAGIQCIYFRKQHEYYALIIVQDIVDKQKEARDREDMQRLALEVLKTRSAFFLGEEHERERLARELHSHIGPVMVSVKLGLEQLLYGRKKHISRRELKRLLNIHTDAIKEVRIVTSRLAEGYGYQEDINKAIVHLINNYCDFSDIRISCKLDPLPDDLPVDVAFHLFQIIEEALTNMVKYANATRATFRIKRSANQVEMVLQDNGQGHNKPLIMVGKGLWMMQQRARLIGGHLVVESVSQSFFRIRLVFSLRP